jgi:integrase/recombinase XerC
VVGITTFDAITPEHCRDFIETAIQTRAGAWIEPSVSTQYVRRTALRLLFRTGRHLALVVGDPTIDIVLPKRTDSATRPLDDTEEATGRLWSQPTLDGTRHPVGWELFRASATGSEAAAATVGDLDLADGKIWLHGNEKWRDPRWGQLSAWGIARIEAHLRVIGTDPNTPLLTNAAKRNGRQASVTNMVSEIMTKAGLRLDPTIKPSSLAAWAGVKVFERTGRIDETAHALGVRSLDRTADIIRCDW